MIAYLIVSSFLISLLTLYFFVAVLLKGTRGGGGRNFAFCLFSLSIFVWSTGHMFWLLSDTAEQALPWIKILVFGSIFIPYTYFHFAVNLTGRSALRPIVYLGYGLGLVLFLLNFGPNIVKGVEPRLGFRFWPVSGWAFPVYFGGFSIMAIFGVIVLFKEYRRVAIDAKNQYKYILLGTGIGFAGGATNFLLWLNIPVPPFGHGLVIVYILGLGYAMLKYRILDFSEMAFRVLGMLVVAILFSGLTAICLVSLLAALYPGFYPSQFVFWWSACLVLSVTLLALGPPLSEIFNRVVQDRFLGHRYAYRSKLKELSDEAALGFDTDESIAEIARRLARILSVDAVAFYIRADLDSDFVCRGAAGNRDWVQRAHIGKVAFLLDHVSKKSSAVIMDEAAQQSPSFKRGLEQVCGEGQIFRRTDLVVPIAGLSETLGFLVLGARRYRAVYGEIDFMLMENLCSQLALALRSRQIERRSNQMEKLVSLGTMAAGLSHELRNPMVSIRTLATLLSRSSGNLKLDSDFSATVQRDVKRISGIVEGVASFAQDSRRPTHPVDLHEVIREIDLVMAPKLAEQHIRLEVVHEKDVPSALGNLEQLIQVFQNIVENAANAISEWEARPEKGCIRITIRCRGGGLIELKRWVEVEVADNGPGIPPEFRSRIFDPFVTSRDTGMRQGGAGTGLGLAIVNKIVELHGGAITVSSNSGSGALFKVSIPCA